MSAHLEWAEELRRRHGEVLGVRERRERNAHRGWLHRAVLGRDRVLREFLATKEKLRPGDREARVDVCEELWGAPREDGRGGELRQVAGRRLGLDLAEDVHLRCAPRLVNEHNRLGAALLPRKRIGVLVRLPSDKFNFGRIWPKNFPIEPSVLQLDAPTEVDRELFRDVLATCEEAHRRWRIGR